MKIPPRKVLFSSFSFRFSIPRQLCYVNYKRVEGDGVDYIILLYVPFVGIVGT